LVQYPFVLDPVVICLVVGFVKAVYYFRVSRFIIAATLLGFYIVISMLQRVRQAEILWQKQFFGVGVLGLRF